VEKIVSWVSVQVEHESLQIESALVRKIARAKVASKRTKVIYIRLSRLQHHLRSGAVRAIFHNQQGNQDIYSSAARSWAGSEVYGPWVLEEPLSGRASEFGSKMSVPGSRHRDSSLE
jgi:hypothetical protein